MKPVNQLAPTTVPVCRRQDLVADSGVCILLNGKQIALFFLPEESRIYAISNWDPIGGANVMSRGVIGDIEGSAVVSSPLYKQHYCLETGRCLEDKSISVCVFTATLCGDDVYIEV